MSGVSVLANRIIAVVEDLDALERLESRVGDILTFIIPERPEHSAEGTMRRLALEANSGLSTRDLFTNLHKAQTEYSLAAYSHQALFNALYHKADGDFRNLVAPEHICAMESANADLKGAFAGYAACVATLIPLENADLREEVQAIVAQLQPARPAAPSVAKRTTAFTIEGQG